MELHAPAPTTGTVAPAWHTLLLLAFLAVITYLSATTAGPPSGADRSAAAAAQAASFPPRPAVYASLLVVQWVLFGLTYVGIRLRRIPVSALLRYRWSGWSGVGRCLLIAVVAWAAIFLGIAQGLDRFGIREPQDVKRIAELILPRGPLEIALWTLVAMTAGFVEEFVFRGYLQRQFGAWFRSGIAGIVLSAAVFGAGHLYQGVASAALIGVVGLCFSVLAHAVKSLVPGMIAHAWEDLFSGLFGRA